MHSCVVGGERGWASGEVGGYSPPAPSQSPSRREEGARGAWGSSRAPRAPSLRCLAYCSGSCHGSASLLPWAPLFVVMIVCAAQLRSVSLSPHCQCFHTHYCTRAHTHTYACARMHAARGLPLYIMQPP